MNKLQSADEAKIDLSQYYSNSFIYEYSEDNYFELIDDIEENSYFELVTDNKKTPNFHDCKPQTIQYFIDDIEVDASTYYDYKPF